MKLPCVSPWFATHRRVAAVVAAWSAFSVAPLFAADAVTAANFPPETIAESHVRVLPPSATGRHYRLSIRLPGSYAKDPARRYPVLYVTDGYWDFGKMSAIYGTLVYDRVAPEFIIVGLGYAGENPDVERMRRWELSPVPMQPGDNAGHAAEFLGTIESEIIPFIDREYRTEPKQRVLAGASLGGMFTLFTMYTKPELFSGYIAATPSVGLNNDWLFGYEEQFVKSGKPLRARLFVAGGANEGPAYLAAILRYNRRVSSRKHPDLAYEFRLIEGERHAGMQLETYTRGLRWIFAPLAPESGPAADW